MTTNYKSMTNEELNRELGEVFFPNADIVVDDEGRIFMDEPPFDYEDWNPTAPHSNQIERFIFPKLHDRGATIVLIHEFRTHTCRFSYEGTMNNFSEHEVCEWDEFNKAKAIAALTAWKELGR